MPFFARPKHRKNVRLYLATAASAVIAGLVLSSVAVVSTTETAAAARTQPATGTPDVTASSEPCYANPVWSYTWNGATGVATVTAAGGAVGQALCTPLYVRAASWNYDTPLTNSTPSWPQTLKATNDYTISAIGTHTITAPGSDCGQDDIYATFSSSGFAALAIDSVLTAPGKPREPSFLHSVISTGTGGSTWHTDSPTLCASALQITKSAVARGTATALSSVEPGAAFDYRLVVTTTGPGGAGRPVVTDTLPIDLALDGTPSYPAGWTYTPTTERDGRQTVTFTLAGSLSGAASATFIIPVTVGTASTATDIENSARACADNTAPLCDTDTVITPVRSITLVVDSVCTNDVPYLHYSITTTNVDLALHPQVTIEWSPTVGPVEPFATTELPSAPIMEGYLLWPGAAVDGSGHATAWPGWSQVDGVWVYDASAPGANLRDNPRITASINPTTTVTVTYPDQVSGCADPEGDLRLVKTQSSPTVTAGDSTSYTLTVTNIGGTAIDGVSITDSVPTSLTVTDVVVDPAVWSGCEWSSIAGHDVSCDLVGPLAAGASASVTIVATVADDVSGSLSNSACVTATPPSQDRDSSNNCSEVSATVPGLAIVKSTGATTLLPGQGFAYSVTVTNPGTAPATDVVVTDTLRPELALTALPSAPGWTCDTVPSGSIGVAGASFRCAMSDPLQVSDTEVIAIPVTVIDSLVLTTPTLTIPNTARVCAANVFVVSSSADHGCPTSTVTVQVIDELTVLAPAGLDIVKTASVAATTPGGSYGYTLLVSNTDFGDTLDVVVSDTLDPRLKLTQVPSGTDWDCSITDSGTAGFGATFECALLVPLVNGAPKSVAVSVLVDAGADLTVSSAIPNTAVVCASNFLGCLQSSVTVALSDSQLDTLAVTGVEAVGLGAIALGALGLGLGLVLLGLTRRTRKQTR